MPAGPADRELAAFSAMSAREGEPLDLHALQVLREVRAAGRITSARAGRIFHVIVKGGRVLDTQVRNVG